MRIYNTLTRQVEQFQPLKRGEIKLYTCGPTVYNSVHIGNLRSFIFDDTLRRALEVLNYKVHHVMNITDVGHLVSDGDEGEDKLEKGAQREGKTVWEVAEYYTEAFKKDMRALNVLPPNGYTGKLDNYARATDFINTQIEMVKLLIEKGFAYQTKQAIYFDVAKLPSYGELTGQKLNDKETAAREEVVSDPAKRHPYDFAVWFFTTGHFTDHSMHWPSPWGDGFPGWHLECSAIIHETLGDPIDIHTGGVDHIGTHHPNEMAQTEAAYGHKLANYWMHNEFVLADGEKMAKSKGNFHTLKDITDKGFDPQAFRLLVLQAHYRSQLNFTWESLQAAQNRLNDLRAVADLRWQLVDPAPPKAKSLLPFDEFESQLKKELEDDLAVPQLLADLSAAFQLMSEQLIRVDQKTEFESYLALVDSALGLNLLGSTDIDSAQKQIIKKRQVARSNKDWVESDRLREQLQKQGIAVRDTTHGQIWARAN